MAKSVILGSFLLVGGVGVAAYPAHLVEDVPTNLRISMMSLLWL